ncbi:uncharacterized protein EAE97_006903 [Botrytis byssoidea]|uniref:Zn(2)-C6 fungal-type domain-containing protein n=1 Tax=Botrytis byssoidea TaxID=139641 RepID=A0A9P5LTS8_9HELO|nr:uncharacterized protein EAE97_006903 [Botrytis byssoidea]KAF7940717.1 hypothetical protein EAE97_006903 [Botrytis byssoidea]
MDTRVPKRQKMTTACASCRGRKIKCDGHQPVCGPCEKRSKSVSCTWATDFSRASSASTDYIRRLEDQIKLLEARNRQSSQISPSSNLSSNSASEELSVETISSHGATTSVSPASATWLSTISWEGYPSVYTPEMSTNQWQPNSASTFSPGLVPSFQELSKSIDAVCTSGNYLSHNNVVGHNHRTNVIDKPFVRKFMQEVEKLVIEKIGDASTHASNIHGFDLNISSSRIPTHESQQMNLDYTLPTREQADSLITLYFENFHVLYPFLDKLEFRQEYEKIWSCDNYKLDQGSLVCLINSVFAISSRQTRTTVSTMRIWLPSFAEEHKDFSTSKSIQSVQFSHIFSWSYIFKPWANLARAGYMLEMQYAPLRCFNFTYPKQANE